MLRLTEARVFTVCEAALLEDCIRPGIPPSLRRQRPKDRAFLPTQILRTDKGPRTLAALKPGGMVAIWDFVMDATRISPGDGLLFGINMLDCTERGRVYSFDEVREYLAASGFERVVHAVDEPTMSAVVTAVRP